MKTRRPTNGRRAVVTFAALFLVACALPACEGETAGPTPGPEQGAAEPGAEARQGAAGIDIAFRLDPRLTQSLHMGDRWVSPPTYTRVANAGEETITIQARTRVRDESGQACRSRPTWTSADPSIVEVAPGPDGTVLLNVLQQGRTRIDVVAAEAAQSLSVLAARRDGALQVDITPQRP